MDDELNENNEQEQEQSPQLPQPQKTDNNPVSKEVKEKVNEKIKKEAAKKAAEMGVKLGVKSSLMAAIAPVLITILGVIIAIIIGVGIIAFFMTVPGMVLEQLKDFATDVIKSIATFLGADATKLHSDEETYEILDYLEQMGYDIKGYGFIDKNANSSDSNYDERAGVIRDADTGLIKKAHSEIIGYYLMSDSYVYTVKNFNDGLAGFLLNALQVIHPFFGSVLERMANTSQWGTGLITIKFENGLDYKKNIIDDIFGTDTSWTNIKIDASAKTLGIRRGWGKNYYVYNMDGWTGRYGMPLEFLLSVHLATMKPDLTYEMITTFNTDVLIKLKDVSGAIVAAYKTKSGNYITFEEIDGDIHPYLSDNALTDFLNNFDDLILGVDEAKKIFELGFDHAKEGCECFDESGNLVGLDSDCKAYIKEVIAELDKAQQYNMKTYVPYLSRVTNHWYRDVYWELSASEAQNLDLIQTDVEYEKKTNERWTLYETYDSGERKGEYKLYKYDPSVEDGIGELYDGTQEEADKEGVKVTKKAVETHIEDLVAQGILDGSRLKSGAWSAYDEEDVQSQAYVRVYPEENSETVRGKIYYRDEMNGTVVQKEDGVRGTTNKDIKDMFLNRQYFNYDGSSKTADIIMEAKKKLGMDFGAVSESNLKKKLKADLGIELEEDTDPNNPRTVADLTSTVTITQESLAAFSMLENTHTLDADYIYRDFKELIVELGYFTKEELSDGTPKLLQWLIPNIGSGGYPKRVLDKKENELGTLAHSKQDYEANEKNELKALLEKVGSEVPPEHEVVDENPERRQAREETLLAGTNTGNLTQTVGGSNPVGDRDPSQVSLNEYIDATREMCEKINQDGYDYCVLVDCDGNGEQNCHHEAHGNDTCSKHSGSGCVLPTNFESSQSSTSRKNFCCATLVSWSLQNVDVMPKDFVIHGAESLAQYCLEDLGGEKIEKTEPLKAGDILCYEGHIDICGEETDGGFVKYNGGHYTATGSVEPTGSSCIQKISGWPSNALFAVRLNWGQDDKVADYEGHLGDEAVVSPVTGILLDYGTYSEEDKDPNTGEEYRKNVDVPEEIDRVGYAKILVLTEEVSDQIVTCSEHRTEGITGKITVSSPPNEVKDMKDWSEEKKSLYGYQLFRDDYVEGDLAGFIVYIDGFKCELPNPATSELEDEEREEVVWDEDYEAGSGEELSMEYFKEKAAKGSGSNFKTCTYEDTLYEADKVYKLLSETLQKKQEARSEAKNIAAPLYSFTGTLDGEEKEMLIIKEGTVIGRTFTDKEIVESRGGTYEKPEEPEEGEEDTREVNGNYLRIIMRDLDDTVVENVEDYMKLDEIQYNQELEFEKFLYWMGVYLEGGHLEQKGGKWVSVSDDLGDGVGATHYFGLTHYVSDLARKLGYSVDDWGSDKDLEMLVDIYLALIEEDKAYVKEQLGDSIPDGYLQAFISIKHNYGNLTKRGEEYKRKKSVSESTWTTYENQNSKFTDGLTKRRVAEWILIQEGKYMNAYEGNTAEIDFPSETPFTDWCKEHGITNIQVKSTD